MTIYSAVVLGLGFMLIVGIFDIKNKKFSKEYSKKSIYPAQYAIKVKGLPAKIKNGPQIKENDLKAFFERNYGPVEECTFAKNYKGCLSIYTELSKIKIEI